MATRPDERCPDCGADVRPEDRSCPDCGADLRPAPRRAAADIREGPEADDRPRRRRDEDDLDDYDDPRRFRRDLRRRPDPGLSALLPINQSPLAIVAGYAGLVALFPLIGLPFGVLAVVFGFLALRSINRDPDRRLGGAYRAIIGIVLGVIGVIAWSALLAVILLKM